MKKRISILLLLLQILTVSVFGQLETNNWFLQSGHLSVKPTGITAGLPNPSNFNVPIASTSLSDASGNLLLASNGKTIINQNLLVMPGIAGIDLKGEFGKVLIHQVPGTTKYYVFYTLNNQDDPPPGQGNSTWTLKYAIVDLSLQGGKGDVIAYDQVIESSSSPSYAIAEGKQPNEDWLIVHKHATDTFLSYRITSSGISSTPVLSKAGSNKLTIDYIFQDLKASFDGSMIAGITYRNYSGNFAETRWLVEVFNFDGFSGQLTNKTRTPRFYGYFYTNFSVEFSPDSRLLYTTMVSRIYYLQPCGYGSGTITQYNPCYTDTTEFSHFSYVVASDFRFCSSNTTWGKIILGADRKMHIPYTGTTVSQINFPNRIGSACGYVFNAYNVPNNSASTGTPQFNPIHMKKAVQNNIIYDGGCYPDPVVFQVTNANISNLSWNFGDPSSADNTSTQTSPAHVYSVPGTYIVTASFLDNLTGKNETLQEQIVIANPFQRLLASYPKDTTICSTANLNFTLKLPATYGLYSWYSRDANGNRYNYNVGDSMQINYSGKYYVELKQQHCNNCILLDSINVIIVDKGGNLGTTRTLCTGDSIILSLPFDAQAQYTWNTGDMTNSIMVKNAGLYKLQIDFPAYGCSFTDSSNIIAAPGVNFNLPNDTTLCFGESLLLNPVVSNAVYYWQDGSTAPSYTVNKAGLYWTRIMNFQGCSATDSIRVNYAQSAKPDLGKDTTVCIGTTLILQPKPITGAYLWSNGDSNNSISVTQPGNYWLQVNNGVCSSRDSIFVSFAPPPLLSLGRDTTICDNNQLVLKPNIANATYTWQDGSTFPSFIVRQAGQYWLKLEKNGCIARDTIEVQYNAAPQVNLGPDQRFCSGDSVILDAGPGYNTYLWSSGQSSRLINVKAAGDYFITVSTVDRCTSKDTITILTPMPLPTINLGKSGPVCATGTKILDAGIGYRSYAWSTGSNQQTIMISQSGNFSVRVTDMNGCKGSGSINITAFVQPPVNFLPADTTICKYGSILLKPTGAFTQYTWSNMQSASSIVASKPGTYWLRVTDNNNCTGTDSIVLTSTDCQIGLFVPNAFTPNNDRKNDLFKPIISGTILQYRFTIYNRFGEVVFDSFDQLQSWDGRLRGKEQSSGVFTWTLRYQLNGEPADFKKGTVVLIR